jgi:hypothetical protein
MRGNLHHKETREDEEDEHSLEYTELLAWMMIQIPGVKLCESYVEMDEAVGSNATAGKRDGFLADQC